MVRKIGKLSPVGVRNETRPGLYGDGAGLWLNVGPTGGKSWLFRFMLNGTREMGSGRFTPSAWRSPGASEAAPFSSRGSTYRRSEAGRASTLRRQPGRRWLPSGWPPKAIFGTTRRPEE